MKGITLCADCAYYNMKKHKCTRGCKIDPDVSKGENPSFYVDCPLPDVEPVQKWIPCSERLPEDGQRVLIWSKSKRFFDVIFRANAQMPSFDAKIFGKVYTWYCEDIIKWMPLPEAPKEDDEDAGTDL